MDNTLNAQITICGEYSDDPTTRRAQRQAVSYFFANAMTEDNCMFYPLAYPVEDPASEYNCEKPREILLHVYPTNFAAEQDPIYGSTHIEDPPTYPYIWHQYECMETGSSWFSGWLHEDGTMEI